MIKHGCREDSYIWKSTADRIVLGRWTKRLEKRWEAERDNKVLLPYLFVSLQLLHKGPLVEETVQAFLSVVVA